MTVLATTGPVRRSETWTGPGFLPPYARKILLDRFDSARLRDATAAMRPSGILMTPEVLRSFKASSLSFARSLVAKMLRERWSITRRCCEVAANGAGMIVYDIQADGHSMTYAVHCRGLDEVERSGRIKDNDLDFHAVLFDEVVPLDRIRREAEEQSQKVWRGRTGNRTLGWTFANRSNRSFEHTVQALAEGRQPDLAQVAGGGAYLLRNAGFYGNGRHGTRSWLALQSGHPLSYPYHVDLFPLYLWRQASFDMVEEIARARSDKAVRLAPDLKRYLGIGNQSGIGMVAALVRWPHWVSGFVYARELALAFVLTEAGPIEPERYERLAALLARGERYYVESDRDIDPDLEDREGISREIGTLRCLVERLRQDGTVDGVRADRPFGALMTWARQSCSTGTCEQLASLLIDLYPERAEAIQPIIPAAMATVRDVQPEMTLGELREILRTTYAWALALDLGADGARRYFWYRSEENGENRRGEREIDPGLEFETFVDVAGAVQELSRRIAARSADQSVGHYLVECPDDVFIVGRVQSLNELPYSEINANILHEDFSPGDLIRFYLHILGMETTNPNNFRWIRGVFMQGAPLPEDIVAGRNGDWALPMLPRSS